jgi:hypothetical protein
MPKSLQKQGKLHPLLGGKADTGKAQDYTFPQKKCSSRNLGIHTGPAAKGRWELMSEGISFIPGTTLISHILIHSSQLAPFPMYPSSLSLLWGDGQNMGR